MKEDCKTINEWANSVFGVITDPSTAIARAKKEFIELEQAVYDEDLVREAADVVIVLMRLIGHYGQFNAVDDKMAINRQRQWKPDGTGHGQHV